MIADKTEQLPVWTYWEGSKTGLIDLSLQTIKRYYPRVRILSKQDVLDLGGQEPIQLTEGAALPHRADLIRCWLMKEFGGIWFDADTLVVKPDDIINNENADLYCVRYRDRKLVTNGHFAMQKGELADIVWNLCLATWTAWRLHYPGGACGGHLLTKVVDDYADKYKIVVRESQMFNPLSYIEGRLFLSRGDDQKFASWLETKYERACSFQLCGGGVKSKLRRVTAKELLAGDWFISYLFRRGLGVAKPLGSGYPRPTRLPKGTRTLFFIHVPKTAGESILLVTKKLRVVKHDCYKTSQEFYDLFGDRYMNSFKFAVRRNPFDRFVSAFYYLKNVARYKNVVQGDRYATPNDLLEELNAERIFAIRRVLVPQSFWHQGPLLDYYLSFERLEEDWEFMRRQFDLPLLPRINTSEHKSWQEELSAESQRKIRDIYASDFKLFGYR